MNGRRAILAPLVLAGCGLFCQPTQAIDLDLVAITAGPAREDAILLDYFLSLTVEGAEISAARALKPGAPPTQICVLVQEDVDAWNCDLGGFSSLDDICQTIGFGNFLFELTAAAGSDDSFTVAFDPGCADPIPGYPVITAPLPGGTVPPVPGPQDFCWDCSAQGACGSGETTVSLFDMDTDLVVEVLRGVQLPACWDPGICIPTGPDQEFEVSALSIFSDFETRFSTLGDEFVYVSSYQSINLTSYDVVGPAPTTPPAVPDGSGASGGLEATRLAPDGSTIEVNWDVESCCGVHDHHLVYGTSTDLPATAGSPFSLDGSVCGLGATGSFSWTAVPDPGTGKLLWWLVLANDTATVEGSWGVDSSAQERTGPGVGGASAQCGKTTKNLTNACGR